MGSTEKVTTGLERAAEDTGAGRFGQGQILNRVAARAYRRTPDQPRADCLDHSLAAGRRRPAVPRRVAFWLVALILTVTMLGTTLPTPLYVICQAQWHFSAVIVTVTFAVYAAVVLTACSPWSASGAPYCPLGGRRRQALMTHPDTPPRTAHFVKEVKRRVLPA